MVLKYFGIFLLSLLFLVLAMLTVKFISLSVSFLFDFDGEKLALFTFFFLTIFVVFFIGGLSEYEDRQKKKELENEKKGG